uniref:CbrC family protein n=1 Tax=Schlesneria paludicola TaxID=360056 RepID=A0A7C2JZ59_9PLAN
MALPKFKYHPDPMATGSVTKSRTKCVCCGKVRGYIYVGPVYAADEYDECICPWCIGDGSAHKKLDAEFTDDAGIGDDGRWGKVSQRVIDEVTCRTPGFNSWQGERWWTHCRDAAQFLGSVGKKELNLLGPPAIAAIRDSAEQMEEPEWNRLFAALRKNGSPTAYLFRCAKCGKYGGYYEYD